MVKSGAFWASIAILLLMEEALGLEGAVGERFGASTEGLSPSTNFSFTEGVGTRTSSWVSPPGGGGSLASPFSSVSGTGDASASSLNSSA